MDSDSRKHSARRFERVTVDVSVRIVRDSGVNAGRGHDISGTGMSVYAPTELAIGEKIRTEFTLPNSRMKLSIDAVVKNRIGFRYGLEFQNPTAEQTSEIRRVTGILALTQP